MAGGPAAPPLRLAAVLPRPELPRAELPCVVEELILPPEAPAEEEPTRLVAARMALEPLRGAPLKPPPAPVPVEVTVPVWLNREAVEVRATVEVEPTVMVELA
jgi:hypothetical protein